MMCACWLQLALTWELVMKREGVRFIWLHSKGMLKLWRRWLEWVQIAIRQTRFVGRHFGQAARKGI